MTSNLDDLINAWNKNKKLEFEIRLGIFNDKNNFNPGVSLLFFNKILEETEKFNKSIIENTISFVHVARLYNLLPKSLTIENAADFPHFLKNHLFGMPV